MKLSKFAITSSFACIAFVGAATLSVFPSADGKVSVGLATAQARVGRPLTPVSVAGVARRTTRRAVVGGAAVGAAVVGGAAVARPRCGYAPYPPCY
jgi:hypothetical protein